MDAPGITLFQLLVVALLEHDGALTMPEIAARLAALGVQARTGDLAYSLSKAWHGLSPVRREADQRMRLLHLDPFLPERKVPRYDTPAERYAAALSLYEMATARLPAWGDALTDPRFDKEAQLTLATDRFPANICESLDGFFRRALHRNPDARFDNARDMTRAWSKVFEDAAKSSSSGHGTVLREEDITLDSPISAIGLSPSSANVLDRLDGPLRPDHGARHPA